MYTIFVGNVCIFDDVAVENDLKLINPVLTLEDNTAGSLEFTIVKSNPGYNLVKCLSSFITVKKRGVDFWHGRPVAETSDFLGTKKYVCEGSLAFLNDTTQPPHDYTGTNNLGVRPRDFLQGIITEHNSKVEAGKRFSVGNVTVSGTVCCFTNYEKTWDLIKEYLIDTLEGHIRIRVVGGVRYIDCIEHEERLTQNTQTITIGQNLLDFTKSFDMTDLATVAIPLGAYIDNPPAGSFQLYYDCSDANNGSVYVVSEEAVLTYGWIEKVLRFEDATEALTLLNKARTYLNSTQFDKMKLVIKAFDLNYADVNTDAIKILDEVHVVSIPHGLDKNFPVTKLIIPLDNPEEATFELGTDVGKTFTDIIRAGM